MSGVAEQAIKKVFLFFINKKGKILFMSKVLDFNDIKLNVVFHFIPATVRVN